MGSAAHRTPQFRVVNQFNSPIEGPYALAPIGTAPTALGLTLDTVESWNETVEIGPWTNYQWNLISYVIGYRLHANLKFSFVESDAASDFYGLTLLRRLWSIGAENQVNYGALQFAMFSGAAWHPVRPAATEFRPTLKAGKQGFYELEFPIVTRELVSSPGDWAKSQW